MRTIEQIIEYIKENQVDLDITLNDPAYSSDIDEFEETFGFALPTDIKKFYSLCDGFESKEDLFRIIDLREITDRKKIFGPNQFYIAEYMVYSSMWIANIKADNTYQIFEDPKTVLTNSFVEFLERFLSGGVFEKGGLYAWKDEIDNAK